MFSLLQTLCVPMAVSGDEGTAAEAALSLLSPLGRAYLNPLGSVLCELPYTDDSLPHVMLTAHLDRIGLMVTSVSERGFVRVASCGGIDRRSIAGARVTVHTASGDIPGVVSAVPPHLAEGTPKPQKVEESIVDVGLSPAEAKERIRYGDRITFDGSLSRLLGDSVCSAALDNRAGCAAVIQAARLLQGCKTARISVALTSQEETGGGGAATAAFALSPDYAFVVDVSMGLTPDGNAERCGNMGEGPMVGFSPVLDRRLSAALCDTAKTHGMNIQREVMSGKTGTDSDAIAQTRGGIRTALISIPLRFMHTPCEVIRLSDLEHTAKLIALQVEGLHEGTN